MKHGMGRASVPTRPQLRLGRCGFRKMGPRADASTLSTIRSAMEDGRSSATAEDGHPPHSVFHPWLTSEYSWPESRLWRLPPSKPCLERRQVRDFPNHVGQVLQDLFERGNSSPGGHRKNLNWSWKVDAQFAVPALETLAQRLGPFRGRPRRLQVVASHPRQPFGNLRLMAPAHLTNLRKRRLHVHRDVKSVGAAQVTVINVQDHRHLARPGVGFVGGIFRREGLRNVDHVSDPPHRFRHRHMVIVDPRERISRQRRTQQIIRLEIADGLPERGEQRRRDLQTSLARRQFIRQPQQLELIPADARRRLLFPQTEPPGFLPRAEVMPGLPIGADDHPPLEIAAKPSPPQFKSSGRHKLKIIEVRMNAERLQHASLRLPFWAASWSHRKKQVTAPAPRPSSPNKPKV